MTNQIRFFKQSRRIIFLKLSAPLLFLLIIFSQAAWPNGILIDEIIEQFGMILVLICISGRCWASLHIGDKKNNKLITQGPYQYTRNPLYFFSSLGMLGIGFVLESLILGIILFCFTYLTFSYVINKETISLTHLFGDAYKKYREKVPKFFPTLQPLKKKNKVSDQLVISKRALKKTFADACLFLLIFPLAELIEFLHDNELVTTAFYLY